MLGLKYAVAHPCKTNVPNRSNRFISFAAAIVTVALLFTGCSSSDSKSGATSSKSNNAIALTAPAACHTDILADWAKQRLAVLWIPQSFARKATEPTPAAITAVDVRDGTVRSYCPLPLGTDPKPEKIPMRWAGIEYPNYEPDFDLMLATQWSSPDFRWFATGTSVVDIAAGKTIELPALPNEARVVGVGHDVALVHSNEGNTSTWCTLSLPPISETPCKPLIPPRRAVAGSFVMGPNGSPTWLSGDAVQLHIGQSTVYAVTDGQRIYRADTETAESRRSKGPVGELGGSVDIAPTGIAGFQAFIDEQPEHDLSGWFTIRKNAHNVGGELNAQQHQTTARDSAFGWLIGKDTHISRAVADDGEVAVSAVLRTERGGGLTTHFGALRDGNDRVIDLTEERGIRCPVAGTLCRIFAWPDGSIDATGK